MLRPVARRQKEKKDSTPSSTFSSASSIASSGSDPKDLDGVALSFSSSPMGSPALPLYPTTAPVAVPHALKALAPSRELYSSAPASASLTAAANKENAGVYTPSGWSAAAQSSSGRLSAAAFLAANSKPAAPSPASAPAPMPTYQYSYPSGPSLGSSHPSSAQTSSSTASSDPYNVPSVYLHRPHNASIIAAKKHVRRRPLGSHAPLARTPSLKNTFEWPPSPPKALGARASLGEVAERSGRKGGNDQEDEAVRGLFAHAKGETVALRANAQRKRSTTPTSSSLSVPTTTTTLETAASKPIMTPVSKARAKDELLRHMESDPPTASSPAGPPASGLTRRALEARDKQDAEDEEVDQLASDGEEEVRMQAARKPALARSMSASFAFSASKGNSVPPFQRAQSLGRTVSLGSSSTATFGAVSSTSTTLDALASSGSNDTPSASSRVGAGLACAIEALGRKRARILETQASLPPPALVPPPTTAAPVRHSAVLGQRKSAKNNVFVSQAKSLRLLSGGRKGAAGLSLDLSGAVTASSAPTRAPQRKKRRVSSESVSTATTIGEDDLAELSFSSTSTTSTVDSLATISDDAESTSGVMGYFALPVSSASATEDKAPEDEQRECAELLLGLGGFC